MLILAAAVLGQEKSGIPTRADIEDRYKWDLSHIYPDWTHWEKGMAELEKMMDQYVALKGTLAAGPENIYKAYKLYDDLETLLYRVYRYPQLSLSLENSNNEYSARFQQVQILLSKYSTASAWFQPELLAIPWETMEAWLNENENLAPYRFAITDSYRLQERILDEKREELLSLFAPFGNTPVSVYNDLSVSDIKYNDVTLSNGETVTVTPAKYSSVLTNNPNQEDRARTFEAHYLAYHVNRNTYASIYNSIMQRNWALTQARQYHSTIESSLDANNIPVKVVDLLIEAVRDGLEPLHRYHKIRKGRLGLKEYHSYDSRRPLVDFSKDYEYDEAARLVFESTSPLGKDYQKTVREAIDNRWIDVYETQGKTTGAYSSNTYGVHPYILMNYNNTMTSVFTLAHEMGHCMHTRLANSSQPKAMADYTLLVAEVASAINEVLLMDYMIENSESTLERVALLVRAIDDLENTFYAQTRYAEYELQAHRLVEQGQPVTADVLTEISYGLFKEWAGEDEIVDSLYGSAWCRVPHFYEAPYYVYQYAASFAAAEKILADIQSEDNKVRQEALDRYMTLLESGGNEYPIEQLRKAGVDMTDPETYTFVIKKMDRLVTRLEQELAKL